MYPASASPVAIPIMSCSATPTLKNRAGNRSANGSSTVNPRSPVSRPIRGPFPASSRGWRGRAGRDGGGCGGGRLASPRVEFGNRLSIVLVGHRPVMPLDASFHERHTLAKRGVRNDHVRGTDLRVQAGDRLRDRLDVVAGDIADVPAEALPPVPHR